MHEAHHKCMNKPALANSRLSYTAGLAQLISSEAAFLYTRNLMKLSDSRSHKQGFSPVSRSTAATQPAIRDYFCHISSDPSLTNTSQPCS